MMLGVAVILLLSPFVVVHVIDHWNDPEYPHSGFSPECPEYIEPDNTLPPVIQ